MSKPSDDSPCRYQIVFRTECGNVLAGVLDDAVIESRDGYTCVVATVRDQSDFYGLLDRFAALALWPVSLIELGAERLATRTSGFRLGALGVFARCLTPRPSSSTAGDLVGVPRSLVFITGQAIKDTEA